MTEYQKMLGGQLYNAQDGELQAMHRTAMDCAPITFGNNVMVAPNCGFYTAAHPLDHTLRDEELEYAKPITVGDSVWIGGGVTVLPGVTIGSRAVIGGGSVVVHDIPEGVVAVGNPCRPIRTL